jgi:hypothetical protein
MIVADSVRRLSQIREGKRERKSSYDRSRGNKDFMHENP